ncbi:YcdB/YcdC domain-containing protein [Bacillus massiliigorillae]|uniref:YcdB/YcdC domain-containing protein n=1 Tax=Bacillus massiliigorillae TaxID=1243664 RepID=UPI00039A2729|nr:YcdB/YcdC domain-containing protein [Bacillus massiliigorillae]
MLQEEIKKLAIELGHIPSIFTLMIEEFNKESGNGFFIWVHPKDDDQYIIIELTKEGQLIKFITSLITNDHSQWNEEQLKERALQYAHLYIPLEDWDALTLENWKFTKNDTYRLTYTQFHNQLTLPYTGFYLDIHKTNTVTEFKYYGIAKNIRSYKHELDVETVKAKYIEGLEMELSIKTLNPALYVNGDNLPHFVYEPIWHNHFNISEGKMEKQELKEEIEEKLIDLKMPDALESKTIEEFIHFKKEEYTKIREVNMDQYLGVVWRHKESLLLPKEDLTFNSYFDEQNNGTLKLMLDPQTNEIRGAYSFHNRTGQLNLTIEECQSIAMQMVFNIYPDANKYFKMISDKVVTKENKCMFKYRLVYNDIPVNIHVLFITVNRTTGYVDYFQNCDIEIETLNQLKIAPTFTAEEAKQILIDELEIEMKWRDIYDASSEVYYALYYAPYFPNLNEKLVAIDAVTKNKIIAKL